MKAKHLKVRHLSKWQKLFCVLMAGALLMLMVPNGLYANAANDESNVNDKDKSEEVKTDETIKVDKEMPQKAVDAAQNGLSAFNDQLQVEAAPWWVPTLKSSVDFTSVGLFSDETSGYFNIQQGKVWPEVLKDVDKNSNAAQRQDQSIDQSWWDQSGEHVLEVQDSVFDDNTLYDSAWISEAAEDQKFYIEEDGTILYFAMFVDADQFGMPGDPYAVVTRVTPIIPLPKTPEKNGLLGANNTENNTVSYFTGWEVSINGLPYIDADWLVDEDNGIQINPWSTYKFKAKFFDVENMSLVHLDFSDAYVDEDMTAALEKDGWYSTDWLCHSYWTKAVPKWTPTYMFYDHLQEVISENLATPGESEDYTDVHVYKDPKIADDYFDYEEGEDWGIYPGPRFWNVDNFDFTMDKETTITAWGYAVSPMGHVNYVQNGQLVNVPSDSSTFEVNVQYYGLWGQPLLQDFYYESYKDYTGNYSPVYYFEPYDWSWCMDYEIAYAVATVTDKTGQHIFLPNRLDAEDINLHDALAYREGYIDFDMEELTYAKIDPFAFDLGFKSFDATFYEDGEQLFDSISIDNFWAIQNFMMPMATNGQIYIDEEYNLVSAFDVYFDWIRPWHLDASNLFNDPAQFDLTPGMSHHFEVKLTANAQEGYDVYGWNYDFRPMGDDEVVNVSRPSSMPYHLISADFKGIGQVVLNPAAGNSAYHVCADLNGTINDSDVVSGSDEFYEGSKISITPDGVVHVWFTDRWANYHEHYAYTAVPQEGNTLVSWFINGEEYVPGSTEFDVATIQKGDVINVTANYVNNGGGGDTPDTPGGGGNTPGGGSAQTGDNTAVALAVLALIALAGAGVVARRKINNK